MATAGWWQRLWGDRESPALKLLKSARWTCVNCVEPHQGMFDLASDAPDIWGEITAFEPNSAVRLEGNFLSRDLCVLEGQHFFIRAVLFIPVIGMEQSFGFGAWTSLSRDNFENYLEGFDEGNFRKPGPWFGWLSNRLADYVGDEPLALSVEPQPDNARPHLYVDDLSHPLAIAQEEGITAEHLLEIYRHHGHGPTSN